MGRKKTSATKDEEEVKVRGQSEVTIKILPVSFELAKERGLKC